MSQDRLELLDYYTLLGLEQGATQDEIRDAYHAFALKFHPDNHLGAEQGRLARATVIFRRGAEAYRVLSSSETRQRYDEGLAAGQLRFDPSDTPTYGSRRPPAKQLQIRSRKARPFFQKAEMAIKKEDWQTAKLNLQIALQHEPGSELIESKLAEVDAARKARKKR